MVREVRSKGVVIMLMSQSPDDFNQPNYNFAREMGLSFVFSCSLSSGKMLDAFLGPTVDAAKVEQLASGRGSGANGGKRGSNRNQSLVSRKEENQTFWFS